MNKYVASILTAGVFWGFMGLFTRSLDAAGFRVQDSLIVRCGLSAIFFAVTLLIVDPRLFKIKPRHIWCFFGSGIMSLLFFTYCYFNAVILMSLSAAAILLYTAPSFVIIISFFVFKEKLSKAKGAALALAFLGCALVSGVGSGSMTITLIGLVFGLCAGFGFALYSIFARLALERGYDSRTINFYSCAFAALGATLIWGAAEPISLITSSWTNAAWGMGTAFITCFLPYLLYTYGLSGVEAGRASIMASVEPVVATLTGIIVFREALTPLGALGVAFVLGAIIILNTKRCRKRI